MSIVGVCWTVFGVVMGYAPKRKVDVPTMFFYSSITACIVCGVLCTINGMPEGVTPVPYAVTFGALFVCGMLNFFQLYLMSKAMERGPNGIIWSLIQSAFVLPFVVGVLFFHARCVIWNAIGVILLVGALMLLGIGKSKGACGKWKAYAFTSMLITGVSQVLSNLPSYYPEAEGISSVWRTAYYFLGLCTGTIIGTIFRQGKSLLNTVKSGLLNKEMWLFIAILQGTEILASIFLLYPGMNLLADAGAGAIAYPLLVASGIVAFDIYSLLLLHERRTWLQKLAMAMILAGIAGLCA